MEKNVLKGLTGKMMKISIPITHTHMTGKISNTEAKRNE